MHDDPLLLELARHQVPQRRVNPLPVVYVVEEPPELPPGIGGVLVFRQIDLLLFDCSQEPLGISILFGFAHARHADRGPCRLQQRDGGRRGILHPLIGMMDLRTPALECSQKGRDRQLLLQAAAQMPAPDRAGEHVHQHCQIHELLPQSNVGDVGHPDLFGTLHFQAIDQVRVPGERVVAVGRPWPPLRGIARDAQLVHQPPHPLGVDRMTPAVKHPCQPAVAVGRPLSGQLPQGVSNRLVLGQSGLMVQGAAMHVERLAEEPDRIFILKLVDHLPVLVEAASSSVEAFFRISICRVARPSSCSSSAMRAWSSSRCSSPWKRVCAFSRKVTFQVVSRLGLRACLRHTSAGDWTPVKTSKTTWALNSGVKRRRFFMRVRLRLLAEHHRTLTRPGVVFSSRSPSWLALSALSDPSPSPGRWFVPSKCRPASTPRISPTSVVDATCTAPSPGTGTSGWSAPRGCWSAPDGSPGHSSTPSAWGTSPHRVAPSP